VRAEGFRIASKLAPTFRAVDQSPMNGLLPFWSGRPCVEEAGTAARPPGYILKLELSWKTALTIAKAMKPTKLNTPSSTTVAIILVKALSWFEIAF
jgi:hypothetical protein